MIWTGEQHAACLRMWKSGTTTRQIAVTLGRTEKSVWHHIRHARDSGYDLPKRPRGYPKGYRKWQPEARA